MPEPAWKKNERDKCRELGVERRGPLGRECSDCEELPLIAPEMKLYKTLRFEERDWEQAKENAEAEGRMPVLSVKERGHNPRDRVVMDWPDFVWLFWLAMIGHRWLGDVCCCLATCEDEEPCLLPQPDGGSVGLVPCPTSLCERPDHDHDSTQVTPEGDA